MKRTLKAGDTSEVSFGKLIAADLNMLAPAPPTLTTNIRGGRECGTGRRG